MNSPPLDQRSYKIYQMRAKHEKSFGAIAELFNLSPSRVKQIYQVAAKRMELRQRGRTESAEYCLSVRALHAIETVLGTIEVTRTEILQAVRHRRLHPGVTRNYGWKTHQEICQWAGVSPEQLAAVELAREVKAPEDWRTGDDLPTPAQLSYLKTLCEEAQQSVEATLTKAQASKKIAELEKRLA